MKGFGRIRYPDAGCLAFIIMDLIIIAVAIIAVVGAASIGG